MINTHASGEQTPPLMSANDLKIHFRSRAPGISLGDAGTLARAVDGISFDIVRGEVLALVGESGSGKTTTARGVLRLCHITSGSVRFRGQELSSFNEREMRPLRRHMQLVSQDPFASLNPFMSVGEILAEPLIIHHHMGKRAREERVEELLALVGLPVAMRDRMPADLSGGQQQRVSIARALAPAPELIVCDEPTSALDVSIQFNILRLLKKLQRDLGLSMLLITHDLGIVDAIADRVAVMYCGKLVEVAPTHRFFSQPLHPYTRALISAVPITDPVRERGRKRILLTGEVPSPKKPPPGCRFHTRCQHATDYCVREEPHIESVDAEHTVACHYWRELMSETASARIEIDQED